MLLLSSMFSLVMVSAIAGVNRNLSSPEQPQDLKCHYAACHATKTNNLNIHILSHTHDDVGWTQTVDHYYDYNVRYILDSVVDELRKDPQRRFIYVEMAFFTRWWDEQTPSIKDIVRKLVDEGRLEFISGGWSMSDEATTHYTALIDEMTLGVRWLNDTFGECARPKVGWQIDPFGHSREQAHIFRKMGFDGMFVGRIHFEDKEWREQHREMEMIWRTDESLGKDSELFLGVLPNVYWPPKGFCFDMYCHDEEVTDSNGAIRAQDLLQIARDQSEHYRTNHTVFTMGLDFHYQDAGKWFRNLDKLIKYMNRIPGVNVIYSTPSCYLKALHDEKIAWSVHTDDFFPYADASHAYWTGYYTSRPNFKFFSRQANGFLQACKQLEAFGHTTNHLGHIKLAQALGVIQHHDGISGTEKQHVVEDYVRMAVNGEKICESQMNMALQKLLQPDSDRAMIKFTYCHWLNVSACAISEQSKDFYVVVYNPYSTSISAYVRLPVILSGYQITALPSRSVPLQIVPVDDGNLRIPERRSTARQEVLFPVEAQPLGASVYRVEAVESIVKDSEDSVLLPIDLDEYSIENEKMKLIVDPAKGVVTTIVLKESGIQMPFRQSLWKYYAYQYSTKWNVEKPSGAYAFNPNQDNPVDMARNVTFRIIKGALVQEIHQVFDSWATQVIRLYRTKDTIEFDWAVGPIPFYDADGSFGKEIVLRFETNLLSKGEFYTDSNGRQDIKRIRDAPHPWRHNMTEFTAGNYYPVVSWIYLKDERKNLQMTILPDRAQGGSSLRDGMLELMVHRRLQYDDGFGVDEPLDELGVDRQGLIAKGKTYVLITDIAHSQRRMKHIANQLVYAPVLSFVRLMATEQHVGSIKNPKFTGLATTLPDGIHILTVEPLSASKVLLRLEYIHSQGAPVTVDLATLFSFINVVSAEETVVSANQYIWHSRPFKWYTTNSTWSRSHVLESSLGKLMRPGDLRTFILHTSS